MAAATVAAMATGRSTDVSSFASSSFLAASVPRGEVVPRADRRSASSPDAATRRWVAHEQSS
eukprot:gene958-687_t